MARFAFNPLVCKVYRTCIYVCLQVTLFFIGSNLTGVICGPVAELFPLTVFLFLVEKIPLLSGFHMISFSYRKNPLVTRVSHRESDQYEEQSICIRTNKPG